MSLQPGAVFAGFTVERLLGAGGMGAVYLVGHPRLRKQVALKVLAGTFTSDTKARAAFEREATLAAGLDHPNIVSVYDRSAPDDPALWLAMRYVGGGDAAGLLSAHPGGLEPERAVRLLEDAAHALDYAHARGVLHRDVKPANLLIENDQRHGESAVLTDFGIARTLDDTVTLSGIAATFAYAAPERFSEEPADHRADIYSLGCTLFQLLTGQPPFPRKDQAAVIGAHLTARPPSPRELRAELPAELDAVIATALAKSPNDRYPSCAALVGAAAEALTSAVVAVPEPPRPVALSKAALPDLPELPTELDRPLEKTRSIRRPTVVSGLAVAGVSVIVTGVIAMRGHSEPPATPLSPTSSPVTVTQQVTSTTAPVQTTAPTTSTQPPVVTTTEDIPPPISYQPPVQQPRYTPPAIQTNPATEAPGVIPQTRSLQYGQ
ncbi:hypothetical protein JMUB6875_03620 [Nocardia sp. JMUB6875]|uniref:serine/threonine-protein kinase n=1 Tax=Nocardia sp. JMUB6875 TaxID=3158170 RepID=UPI0032E7AF60